MPAALLSIFHVFFHYSERGAVRTLQSGVLSDLSRVMLLVVRDVGFKPRRSGPRVRAHHHHALIPDRTPGPTLQSKQDTGQLGGCHTGLPIQGSSHTLGAAPGSPARPV